MIVKSDADLITPYLSDASNMPGGSASEVVIPETQDELREFMQHFSRRAEPLTIAGSGTGLAGGRVPHGGTIVSTERLNRIVSVDIATLRGIAEPGVILQDYQSAVEEAGLLYPPDPTERACSLGGTVAANSSGARTFKYGATRTFIERLRIFLADGEELHLRRGECFATNGHLTLRSVSGKEYHCPLPRVTMPDIKHAAGYFVKPDLDAIDLFIGSEGTLGIIAEIETRLLPQPERIIAGVIFFDNLNALFSFVEQARHRSLANSLGDHSTGLSARALEFFDSRALDFVRSEYSTIPQNVAGAVWFEQEITDETEEALLTEWYELIGAHTPFMDESWFAITEKDQETLREFRHTIPAKTYERIRELGQQKIGTDMAVPHAHFPALYEFYEKEFAAERLQYIIYGHIGNSHVHANIFTRSPEEYARARQVYHRCVEKAMALGGTISAEHGVGKIKTDYLRLMYGESGINDFRALKAIFDPNNLIGRGTMFS